MLTMFTDIFRTRAPSYVMSSIVHVFVDIQCGVVHDVSLGGWEFAVAQITHLGMLESSGLWLVVCGECKLVGCTGKITHSH